MNIIGFAGFPAASVLVVAAGFWALLFTVVVLAAEEGTEGLRPGSTTLAPVICEPLVGTACDDIDDPMLRA